MLPKTACHAQDPVVIVGRLADGTPPIAVPANPLPEFEILETTARQLPGRTLTIHHVSEASLRLDAQPISAATTSEEDALSQQATPPTTVLTISATVLDRESTLLHWAHDGKPFAAWSNIDFNYLTGFTQFRKGERHYVNLMLLENLDTSRFPDPHPYALPDDLCIEEPAFLPIQGDIDDPTAFEAVLALHELYFSEGHRLKQAFEAREAVRSVEEAEAQTDPPPAKDIILYYTKVPSRQTQEEKR
jgi:hypothetical protein